jgi:hypothetical protein
MAILLMRLCFGYPQLALLLLLTRFTATNFTSCLRTPAFTSSWLLTTDFVSSLNPNIIISGHVITYSGVTAPQNLHFTRSYVEFWQTHVENKGVNYLSPQIVSLFNQTFPILLNNLVSAILLNITAEQFGRNGTRQYRGVDLEADDDISDLDGWSF